MDAAAIENARIALGQMLNTIGNNKEEPEEPSDPAYSIAISNAAAGGAGFTRNITITAEKGASLEGKYIVVQFTQGSGVDADVSVVVYKVVNHTSTISYNREDTVIDVWLASGMPKLTSEDMGAVLYTHASAR